MNFMEKMNLLNNEKYLKHRWIIVFLMMIPFYNNSYKNFQIIPTYVMEILGVLVFVALCVLFVLRKKKVSLLFVSLVLIQLLWLVSTKLSYRVRETEVYINTFYDISYILAIGLFVEYFKDDPFNLTKGLMLNMELAIYPNLISILINPNPEGRNFLLSYYTILTTWFLPALCIAYLYSRAHNNYIRGLFLSLAVILSSILIKCATNLVALMGVFAVLALGLLIRKSEKLSKYKILLLPLLIIAVAVNYFFINTYIDNTNYPIINSFFNNVLGKSNTLTGRVEIWRISIRTIYERLLIGHGYRPMVFLETGTSVPNSHNEYLQVLNAKGWIGMSLFALFHLILCIKVDKSKNTIARLVMIALCFGIFITYITESYRDQYKLYLIFFIAYHIDDLLVCIENNEFKE